EGFPSSKAALILSEQIVRSLGSVGANIAEGFNRSQKRFVNSLDIALGEANEAENWLYKARDAGFIAEDAVRARLKTIIEIEKMLTSLKRSIAAKGERVQEEGPDYVAGEEVAEDHFRVTEPQDG
ncbi:MAG: four helix bundle protein, partial [Candidatus Brocadiae bacterium]|nr:four helix bundle protein [Candidatus Brocadiia bacterium]